MIRKSPQFRIGNGYDIHRLIKNRNLFNENNLENFGGLTVDNSILLRSGESNMNFDYDSLGNLLGSYSYSFSNIFW